MASILTLFPAQQTKTLGAYEFLLSNLTGSHLLSFSVSSRLQRRVAHLPQGWSEKINAPSKNDWYPKFLTQGNLAPHNWLLHSVNHCRVMTHYSAWKTSLSILCRSDSITYHFLLVNKTALLKDVLFVVSSPLRVFF